MIGVSVKEDELEFNTSDGNEQYRTDMTSRTVCVLTCFYILQTTTPSSRRTSPV